MENAAKRRWFVRGDVEMCLAPQRRAIFRHLTFKKWSEPVSFLRFWLENVLRATAACNFWTSQLPKWLRPCGVLCILTCKCASRHSGMQFLNIATSKMAPPMWCFVHFDLQMCFSPQPRAIFEHRNFQNGSDAEVFSTFWRANVLRATAACHFSPVRETATSAPAALAKLLDEHQEPRLIEKTQRFATSLTFGAHVELLATDSTRMLIFVLLTLHACWSSCYWLYTHVDLLATDMTAVRLCFSTLHIVGS